MWRNLNVAKGRFSNVHSIVNWIIENIVEEHWICVDATVGNGNDFLKILNKLNNGFLYGFDVQEIAINTTKSLLESENSKSNYKLILDSHENVKSHIFENIDFFIMNLGYLPGGDKNITTTKNSTKSFLENAIDILNINGIGVVVFYPGHEMGKDEFIYINEYLSRLDQKLYNILKFDFINQRNNPPQLIVIERI